MKQENKKTNTSRLTKDQFINGFLRDGYTPEERLLKAIYGKGFHGKPVEKKDRTRAFAEWLWKFRVQWDRERKIENGILASKEKVVEFLREYNEYRTGKGKYEWHEEPEKNQRFPYTETMITKVINKACDYILEMCESKK